MTGDFNADGVLDAIDIDLLNSAIGATDPAFDLNSDGIVSTADRTVWVEDLKNTFFGDSNLDGEFNTSDFIHVFQRNDYEDGIVSNSGWSDGDWNGDEEFDSSDFIVAFQGGGFESGPRASVSSVPEPSGLLLLIVGLCGVTMRRRGC